MAAYREEARKHRGMGRSKAKSAQGLLYIQVFDGFTQIIGDGKP